MKKIAPLLALLVVSMAHADPKIVYVGDGRHSCSGSDRDCAAVRQRNDDQANRTMERIDRERRESEYREQQRQTRNLEEIRDEVRRRER